MVKIILEKLLILSRIDIDKALVWDGIKIPITIDEVVEAISQGILPESTPYGDIWRHSVKMERDRNYVSVKTASLPFWEAGGLSSRV